MSEVIWQEWGEEAFAEARRLDKPILLDIGAVWCHWCHVMDHGIPGDPVHTGTYSDPRVIAAINRDYIPIKVDNDRRPDINARYNMGGWPTTAFLTPSGDTLYGATYLTPPQMAGMLESIVGYYRENKDSISVKVKEYEEKRIAATAAAESAEITVDIIDHVIAEIKRNFDPAFGGFGSQPKFPHPDTLNFALEQAVIRHDDDLLLVAEKTISGMATGGMYDQFAGGFFRYSTTRDWSIPHFEKMLEDNTRLLSVCIKAFQLTGDEHYKDISIDVARFLNTVMFDSRSGAFAGSQDADKEDEYYGRPLSERELMSTPFIDWTVYVDWNALVVSAYTHLYQQLGDKSALETASRLYEFISGSVFPDHYSAVGVGGGTRYQLTDIVALCGAALDLYESTGGSRYLSEARGLADMAITDLFSESAHLFSDIAVSDDLLGALSTEKFDQEDNAHMAEHLLRLSVFAAVGRYRSVAESIMRSLSTNYRQQSYFASAFARSCSILLSESVHVVLVGDQLTREMNALRESVYRSFALGKTVELRAAENEEGYPPDADGRPVAYVCVGTVCSRPETEPAEVGKLIAEAVSPR